MFQSKCMHAILVTTGTYHVHESNHMYNKVYQYAKYIVHTYVYQ